MPYYPYRCINCSRRFEVFLTFSDYGVKPVKCPHCASENVQRRITRVRIARSEDSRLEDIGSEADLEGLENDPAALGRMMRKMSKEVGEDMGPEFGEVIDRLEAGQSPEQIEQSLPDLGEAGMGMGGDSVETGDSFD